MAMPILAFVMQKIKGLELSASKGNLCYNRNKLKREDEKKKEVYAWN